MEAITRAMLPQPKQPQLQDIPQTSTTSTHQSITTTTKRRAALATMASLLLSCQTLMRPETAHGFGLDLRFVAPEQSIQEAMDGVRGHAESLLEVKSLIESESWKEAQKALRESSALLKQDVYTIIQNKPGSERKLLRKLYSDLFNSVSRMDYAARDKDVGRVLECYQSMCIALDEILSRIDMN